MSVQVEYKNRNPRGYWFSPDTMRFFRSRVGREYWRKVRHPNGFVMPFVTSEKPPHGPRRHSVRFLDTRGEIHTVGEFCAYSYATANRMARELAREGETITPEYMRYKVSRRGVLHGADIALDSNRGATK